jgi:hypothetical protein
MLEDERTVVIGDTRELTRPATRRGFLRALGLGGTVVLLPSVFAACDDAFESNVSEGVVGPSRRGAGPAAAVTLDLSTDVGIFNYSLIIEQLEQTFYTQLTALPNFESLFPAAADREAIVDIRNDEYVHRAFITAALGSAALPQLTFNFGDAFASRQSVLAAARTFNSVGVAALNGGGQFIRNANNLLVAGKLASVEGRHGATLYDLDDAANTTGAGEATGQRFADLTALAPFGAVDANALDAALNPSQVLALSDPYVVNPINAVNVPA